MTDIAFDFGEVIVPVEDEDYSQREEDLEYINDFLEDFVEFVETKIPDIVDQFIDLFPARHNYWCKQGYVIIPGGRKYERE